MRQANAKRSIAAGLKLGLVTMMALAAVTGCTKKKELKNMVDPSIYVSKADFIQTDAQGTVSLSSKGKQFHLIRGIEDANSENKVGAVPGYHEDFGIVQARITENELQFVSVFHPRGRPETMEIIASYPIMDHFDIKRDENDFGEQTNRIVEDRQRPWDKRQYMRVDWNNPSNANSSLRKQLSGSIMGASFLDIDNVVLLEAPKNENGHISWLVEANVKDVREDYQYAADMDWEFDKGARIFYRTHLMPVKSSDFKPVEYSWKDFSRFGYFYTQNNFEDPEKGFLDSGIKKYANVFNVCEAGNPAPCAKKQIVWVLSKGFPSKYLDKAREAVAEWNGAFKEALNREDDVVVLDESIQAEISDPRHNVIAFYEPKSPGGLLGVAQFVTDPRTGEMVAARATVYEDGIRYMTGIVDTIIDAVVANDPIADVIKTNSLDQDIPLESPFEDGEVGEKFKQTEKALKISDIKSSFKGPVLSPAVIGRAGEKTLFRRGFTGVAQASNMRKADLVTKNRDVFALPELSFFGGALAKHEPMIAYDKNGKAVLPEIKGLEKLLFVGESIRAEKARFLRDSARGIHGAELVEEATIRYLKKLIGTLDVNQLKSQKDAIKARIAQDVFYTTLLHEMGHTFGLRHNFEASTDRKHYHSSYEAKKKALEETGTGTVEDLEPLAYSSIMDYGADFTSQGAGLGSYDKAAIRYAYNRGIQRDGDAVTLANFKFCTDHEVDETITCRRFDRGSTVSEITANMIKRYHNQWALSHFRRGRADFDMRGDNIPGYLLQGMMLPIRQAMDEFMYTLISGKTVANPTGSICDYKFVAESVKRGEIANVCDLIQAENAGVDPTDLGTFAEALFQPGSSKLRVKPSEYVPYGMGDLMYANVLAMQFFTEVLGSTEPGTFLAVPPAREGEGFRLVRLDKEKATDEEKLAAFAQDNGEQDVAKFVKEMKPYITEIRVGRYGKPFESAYKMEGGYERLERVGSFWDKYVAMIALATRDVGVRKYQRDDVSLSGNAYSYPLTKKFATRIFDHMITGTSQMGMIPVQLKNFPKRPTVPAAVDASMDVNTRALAAVLAFSDIYTSSEPSIIEKLRVCSSNDNHCRPGLGEKVVEFTTNNGELFRASQTLENDSIAFKIVSEAKALADQRDELFAAVKKVDSNQVENLMKLDDNVELRTRIHDNLGEIVELAELQKMVTDIEEGSSSAWKMLIALTENIKRVPLFTTLTLAGQIDAGLATAEEKVKEELTKMGETGLCEKKQDQQVPASCKKTPEAIRRRILTQLERDLAKARKIGAEVLEADRMAKIAPLQLSRIAQDLAEKEADLRRLRKLMKDSGND